MRYHYQWGVIAGFFAASTTRKPRRPDAPQTEWDRIDQQFAATEEELRRNEVSLGIILMDGDAASAATAAQHSYIIAEPCCDLVIAIADTNAVAIHAHGSLLKKHRDFFDSLIADVKAAFTPGSVIATMDLLLSRLRSGLGDGLTS